MTRRTELLDNVKALVKKDLAPLVDRIDREGYYPEDFMYALGALGGFASVGSEEEGGNGLGLSTQIDVIRLVGTECGATAFSVWCQSACAWYLHQSTHQAVKTRYLSDILQGKVLAGTGMSNTVKHLADIEKHLLQATKVEGGYIVNGTLPWVSNIETNHVWASTAQLDNQQYVMFMVRGDTSGISLHRTPEFCALEGTRTFSIRYENVFIKDEDVLAEPQEFKAYIQRIKAGFILLQIGIGAGIIEGCLNLIRLSNVSHKEINAYLDNGYEQLKALFDAALEQTQTLADQTWQNQGNILEVLKLRLAAAELSLTAAQSAALHLGAKGYLLRSPAQRRMREAMFVAIVTPATKHLKKEIQILEQNQ